MDYFCDAIFFFDILMNLFVFGYVEIDDSGIEHHQIDRLVIMRRWYARSIVKPRSCLNNFLLGSDSQVRLILNYISSPQLLLIFLGFSGVVGFYCGFGAFPRYYLWARLRRD